MKRWLVAAVALIALLAVVGWKISAKNAETADRAKQRTMRASAAIPVQAVTAKVRDIIRTYNSVGSLEAPVAVDITPRVTGRILELSVREGDRVSTGQVLARLDTSEIQAQISQKQATLAQARSRLAEAQTTQGAAGVSIESEISRQRTALNSARALAAKAIADEASQIGAAQANVTEAKGKVSSATADIGSAEAAVATAQANVDRANTELERQTVLVQEGATAQQNLDNARTAKRVQDAALAEAKKRRDATIAVRDSAIAARVSVERQVELTRNATRASRLSTQSNVKQIQATLEAATANRAQTPAYAQNIAALRAGVTAGEADVRAAEAQRDYTILRAPISGVVTRRNLDTGALATANQPVLSLQNLDQIWLTLGVPEEIYGRLSVGQTATVTIDSEEGSNFQGKIERLNPGADPQTRQFTVRVRLENSMGRLRPGAFAHVSFITERIPDALTVPREAVRKGEKPGAGQVAVVNGDTAQLRPVTTGAEDTNSVQITSGLQPSESVIILSGRDVKDGQKIKLGDSKGASKAQPSGMGAPSPGATNSAKP
jgi:HlyD family secretion protein